MDFEIRGAASARTLVLVDGQPIGDPTTGTVDLTQLSTAGVQRIEIVESAASALYGTSASGGVINVITSVPRGTYLEGSLGSFDDRDVRVGFGNGLIGANFERHVATNAYAYPALTYGLPGCTTTAGTACNYSAGVRDNAYGNQSSGRISADLPLPAGFAVRGRLDATSLDIGVPSRLDFLTPNTTNRLANDSGLVEVARTTANGTLSIDASGTTQRSAYADHRSAKTTSCGDVRRSLLKTRLRVAAQTSWRELISRVQAASSPFPVIPFRRAARLRRAPSPRRQSG